MQKWIDKEVYDTHNRFNLKDLTNYHLNAGLHIDEQRYLQLLDLSILNYSRVFKGSYCRIIAKFITALNIPLLKFERLAKKEIQSSKFCSSMVVVATKKGEIS